MNVSYLATQLFISAAGGIITLTTTWYFLKADISRLLAARAVPDQLPGLRLQAYERLILFIERMNPANLLVRLYQPGFSAQEFQVQLLAEIRAEFQHNVSQQLYIHTTSWNVIRQLKDDTTAMIQQALAVLPEDAGGRALSIKVLEHLAVMPENPYDLALDLIKKDIHQLF